MCVFNGEETKPLSSELNSFLTLENNKILDCFKNVNVKKIYVYVYV